jgi:hypothetical protein
MRNETQTVMRRREAYASNWAGTYEPIRRSISGTWKLTESEPLEIKLDSYGGYRVRKMGAPGRLEGRYAIVPLAGDHYIVLGRGDEGVVLRIDEIDRNYMRLSSSDNVIELSRRAA